MPRKAAKTPALKPSRARKAPPTPPTDNAASDAERQTEDAKPDAAVSTSAAAPRPEGKLATLTTLLRRVQGATLDELTAATGWQAHSIRGAISGALKKKQGLEIASVKADGVRTYRIARDGG